MADNKTTPTRNVAPAIRIYRTGEQPTDFACWQSVPYAERLAVLEQIRRDYHRWKYGAEPRLHKVYSIAPRTS